MVPSSCRGIPTFGAATLGARAQPPPRAPQLVAPRVAVTRGLGIDALIRPARNWTLVSLATPQAHPREGPLPWEKSSHNNNRSSSTLPGLNLFTSHASHRSGARSQSFLISVIPLLFGSNLPICKNQLAVNAVYPNLLRPLEANLRRFEQSWISVM